MNPDKIKFIVVVFGEKIEYQGEIYQEVLEKLTFTSLKSAKRIAKKLKQLYPKNKVVIKERFREGWKIIANF